MIYIARVFGGFQKWLLKSDEPFANSAHNRYILPQRLRNPLIGKIKYYLFCRLACIFNISGRF